MAHRTLFAGLSAPDPGESINVQNGDFVYHNPDLIDQFLRVGAVSHRHDAHLRLADPQTSPSLVAGSATASAGGLQSDTIYYVTYTLVDQYGGETRAAPEASVLLVGQVPAPSNPPSAGVDYTAGIMPAGNYAYAVTYTDGQGGETNLGPTSWVYINPGNASAQVKFVGLAAQLTASGGVAVNWRLWRSYEGSDWHLVAQQGTDTFTDAGFDPPDNPARPPDRNDTAATTSIVVTLPAASAEPTIASASQINVYLSTDPALLSPAFYQQLPIACAGASFTILSDAVSYGSPPPVSTSLPGAAQINPETDILNFHWRTPVSTWSALPSGATADVRMTLDTGHLWAVLGASGASGPSGWTDIMVFDDPDPPMVASAGVGSGAVGKLLGFAASGEAIVAYRDLGGGSGVVTVYAPSAVSSFVASASNATSTITKSLAFAGSGAATVTVTDEGGGSGLVTVTVPTVTGPQGPAGAVGPPGSSAVFTASAGSASAVVGGFLGFAGAGGATAQLQVVNGSAVVVVTAGGGSLGGGSIAVTASAGASAVSPTSSLEFDASGGIGVAISNPGGGSAVVTLGAAPTKLIVGARGTLSSPYNYSIYGNVTNGNVAVMGVNQDGTPRLLPSNAQPGGGTTPATDGMACSPDGFNVYELDGGGAITVFARHADGTLTKIQSITGLDTPQGVTVSPDGTDVYVTQQGTHNNLQRFRRSQIDGTLTKLETYACAGTPYWPCVTPDGKGVYVNSTSGASQFRRNTDGSLIPVGSPTPFGFTGQLISSPDSRHIYFSSNSGVGCFIEIYSRNGDMTLTRIGRHSVGVENGGLGLTISPDGLYLYMESSGTNLIYSYLRNPVNGTLSDPSTDTFVNNGAGTHLAITPDGQFLYCPNANANGLQCYRRNTSDGTLSYLGNYITSQAIGTSSCPVAVSPIAQSVAAANDIEIVGSGGITVTVGSGSTGSALVTVSGTPPVVAGSGGITPVSPDYYTEYAGSGGISVAIQNMGSGSARVLIGWGHGGTATLASGTVTVSDPSVTANSRIQLTPQDSNTTGVLRVTAKSAGSFTITSTVNTDTGVVAYDIFGT